MTKAFAVSATLHSDLWRGVLRRSISEKEDLNRNIPYISESHDGLFKTREGDTHMRNAWRDISSSGLKSKISGYAIVTIQTHFYRHTHNSLWGCLFCYGMQASLGWAQECMNNLSSNIRPWLGMLWSCMKKSHSVREWGSESSWSGRSSAQLPAFSQLLQKAETCTWSWIYSLTCSVQKLEPWGPRSPHLDMHSLRWSKACLSTLSSNISIPFSLYWSVYLYICIYIYIYIYIHIYIYVYMRMLWHIGKLLDNHLSLKIPHPDMHS